MSKKPLQIAALASLPARLRTPAQKGCVFFAVARMAIPVFLVLSGLLSSHARSADVALLDMPLEELLDVQVTSVSKKQQDLREVPSAVFVISRSDIRQSGVTNIPDALRMAPGVQVHSIDSNKWAISARGFNGRFSNKLLVMIDGRTVYSPTYSGVNWNLLNVRIEDIDRIEVVRGPGGSIWGANAVNGVINIITRHTADTIGAEVVAGAGDYEELILNGRMGGKLTQSLYGRLSFNANQRADSLALGGEERSNDEWDSERFGLRLDHYLGKDDTLALTAEYGEGDAAQTTIYPTLTPPYQAVDSSGLEFRTWHILGRWDHAISPDNSWSLQLYYDRLDREDVSLSENRDTYDIDFTHRFSLGKHQAWIWGMEYRQMNDHLLAGRTITVSPPRRSNELFSAFFQDQIEIGSHLSLVLGAKWEHNDHTGGELQPNIKLSWGVSDNTQIWASVAKAVRIPTITEVDADVLGFSFELECTDPTDVDCPPLEGLPFMVASAPSDQLPSEEVIAYEAGWRSVVSSSLNLDVAVFFNDYSNLRSFSPGSISLRLDPVPHLYLPVAFSNRIEGETFGIEVASQWAPNADVSLDLAYAYNEADIDWRTPFDITQNTPAPHHQLSLRSHYRLTPSIALNAWLRYVDATTITGPTLETLDEVDPYTEMDLNIAWQATPRLEFRLVGRNLLDSAHPEYKDFFISEPTEVERSFYLKATVRF